MPFEIPSFPAPPSSGWKIVRQGLGPVEKSDALLDLWKAAGKPLKIGYAAQGAARGGMMGVTWPATLRGACAVAAVGLYEQSGRLYGRVAGATVAAPAGTTGTISETTTIESGQVPRGSRVSRSWRIRDLYKKGATGVRQILLVAGAAIDDDGNYQIACGSRAIAGGRATGSVVGVIDLQMSGNRVLGRLVGRGPVDTNSLSIDNLAGGALVDLTTAAISVTMATIDDGGASGLGGWFLREIAEIPGNPKVAAAMEAARALRVATFSPGSISMDWSGAEAWARQSVWVRRKSWANQTQYMRFEAGKGSVPAVFVIESNAIARRVVRATEFGLAELLATDWTLAAAAPTSGPFDLTRVRIALRVADRTNWLLFAAGKARIIGTNDPPPEDDDDSTGSNGDDCCGCP